MGGEKGRMSGGGSYSPDECTSATSVASALPLPLPFARPTAADAVPNKEPSPRPTCVPPHRWRCANLQLQQSI